MADDCKKANKTLATGDRTIPPPNAKMITIYIMGREYQVPETLTIMKAIEYAGYSYTRGCGCRGGICGACGTFYRFLGDYRLMSGLACQTVAEDNMVIMQLPFFPAEQARVRPRKAVGRLPRGAPPPVPRGLQVRRLRNLHKDMPHGHRCHGLHSPHEKGRPEGRGPQVL